MASKLIIERPPKTRTPRRFARHRVEALMYVDLAPENGGFPINISENGMAFQGIRPLEKNQEICITIKLDGIGETVIAIAKVVWLTASRKGGGLQFVDLPDASQRLIRNWISLQREIDHTKQSAILTISRVKVKGRSPAPVAPPEHDDSASLAKVAAEKVSEVVIPSEARNLSPLQIQEKRDSSANKMPRNDKIVGFSAACEAATVIATPAPSSLLPAAETSPTITPNLTSKAKPDVAKSLPLKQVQASTALQRPPRVATRPATGKKKSSWYSAYGLELSAFLALLIVCGVMLWPIRDSLFQRLDTNVPVQTDVYSAPEPAVALPAEQTPVGDPPSDPSMEESLPLAPIPSVKENLEMLSPANVTASAPSYRAKHPGRRRMWRATEIAK